MSPEKEREYQELLAFVDFHATNINGIDPRDPVHPTNAGAGIVAEFGRSRALQGTKQAVNDIIEELSYQPAEYVALLDRLLRERGIVTVSEIRRRYASSYRRILKRGRIRNETEYYLIAGVLASLDSLASAEERQLLDRLVTQYEQDI